MGTTGMSEGEILADQKVPPDSGGAARRITTCPPRFLDFATCLNANRWFSPAYTRRILND